MKRIQQGFTLIELMIVVAIIGILAAIAIPQYQDYTAKSQAAEASTLLDGLKTPISEAISQDTIAVGCAAPTNAVTAGKYVASMTFTAAATTCKITATYATTGVNPKVSGQTMDFTFTPTTGAWVCTTSLAANIKPKAC